MSTSSIDLIRQLARRLDARFWLQIREKDLDGGELFRFAESIQRAMRGTDAHLLINTRADVARCLGPKVGVQLPESGLSVDAARMVLSDEAPIGCSVHDLEGAKRAVDAGADLITLAPIHAVPGKGPGLGLDRLNEVGAALVGHCLVFALGGVVPAVLDDLMGCEIDGVAAIRSVWRNELVNAHAFLLKEAPPGPT